MVLPAVPAGICRGLARWSGRSFGSVASPVLVAGRASPASGAGHTPPIRVAEWVYLTDRAECSRAAGAAAGEFRCGDCRAFLPIVTGAGRADTIKCCYCTLECCCGFGDEPRGPVCQCSRAFRLISLGDRSACRVCVLCLFPGFWQVVLWGRATCRVVYVLVDRADAAGKLEHFFEDVIDSVRVGE